MEGVIGLFKTECINTTLFHDGPYKTLADVEYATAGWADWYNHRRLHGSLGYIPRPNTSKPTTLPSPRRSSPHDSGTKPGTIQASR
jgi:putative transposase